MRGHFEDDHMGGREFVAFEPDPDDMMALYQEEVDNAFFAPLPESLARYIAEQDTEAPSYVHACILNPGPNRGNRPIIDGSAYRGILFALAFESAFCLLVWLVIWAAHRWNF